MAIIGVQCRHAAALCLERQFGEARMRLLEVMLDELAIERPEIESDFGRVANCPALLIEGDIRTQGQRLAK